ncbi:MAG: hypothetical protein ACK559_01625 [bacterium]
MKGAAAGNNSHHSPNHESRPTAAGRRRCCPGLKPAHPLRASTEPRPCPDAYPPPSFNGFPRPFSHRPKAISATRASARAPRGLACAFGLGVVAAVAEANPWGQVMDLIEAPEPIQNYWKGQQLVVCCEWLEKHGHPELAMAMHREVGPKALVEGEE